MLYKKRPSQQNRNLPHFRKKNKPFPIFKCVSVNIYFIKKEFQYKIHNNNNNNFLYYLYTYHSNTKLSMA